MKIQFGRSSTSSPPSSPCSSNHSSTPPFSLFSHDISRHFKIFGIVITSCLKEIKFTYINLTLLFHSDKWKNSKSLTKKDGSEKFKYVYDAYESSIESSFLLEFKLTYLNVQMISLSYYHIFGIDWFLI